MPEAVLKKWKEKLLPQWKVCFFAALAVGFLAHFYKLTNWLPNWDSLVFRYDPQNMIAIGRWFLPVVCSFSSFYDLPFLNGVLAIFFHALSAVLICRILKVEKKVTAFLIGAVVVSFPTVTSVLMYNYVADGYSISFFFSVWAAFLLTRKKPKYLLALVLIALSMGIYQAYVTVTVMLLLLRLIDDLLYHGESFGTTLKKGIGMLFAGVLAAVLYCAVLALVLKINSTELLDYQGASSVASLSGIRLSASFYTIKLTFLNCFFPTSGGIGVFFVLNLFIFLFTAAYSVKAIVKNKIYQKPLNLLMIVLLGAALIPAASALAFINGEVDYHNLMLMGYVVFYLFFLVLYERDSDSKPQGKKFRCWAVLLTVLVLVSNQVVIANVSYHKAGISYEKSYGILIRIADRIEKLPEAEDCKKILVLGALENSAAYSAVLPPEITGVTDGLILRADDEVVHQSVLCSALNDYCDQNFQFVSGEEKKALSKKEEVKNMEQWPSEHCVLVVEDTVVIKLSSEGEVE